MVINYDLPQTAVAYIHRIGEFFFGDRAVICGCGVPSPDSVSVLECMPGVESNS
jgi:molybdopterin synthase catalytic subunit